MKNKSLFTLLLFAVFLVTSCYSQNTCKIEDYYLNEDIFKIDTTYSNVLIDGKSFKINILSDKLDEYLEKYEDPEFEFDDVSPKTVVFYSDDTEEIVYVKKFDASKPDFVKQNGNLSKEGKLYLHWMSSGGGSGFSSNTSLVSLQDGKIVLTEIFKSGEMDFVLFNKNDKEIYILQGIWGDELDQNGEAVETHFSNHRYKILQYRFGYDGFEEMEIGITKNKYSSLDEGKSATEILNDIVKEENFMPVNTVITEYVIFDNFNGVIVAQ